MRYLPWYAAGATLVAAFVTHLLVPAVTRLAIRLRALDHPDVVRKLQASAMPRLGGVAIFGGLSLAALVPAISQWGTWGTRIGRNEILALGGGTLLVFLVGVADDLRGVGTAMKFLVQLTAAALLVSVGWSFEVLRLPLVGETHLGLFGGIVSLFWIVGVTNAINLLDGLDGLAGGVVAIIALSMLGYAAVQGSPGTIILMAATAGACVGFLRHNWAPARIFMGDSGSLTLGFLLAAVSVHSALKAPATVAILVPVLALGLPVMDTLLVMAVRFLSRQRMRPVRRFLHMFQADRKHLHHLLQHLGAGRPHVVGLIYVTVVAFCAMALLIAVTGQSNLGLLLIVIEFLVVFGMRRIGTQADRRSRPGPPRGAPVTPAAALPPAPAPTAGRGEPELRVKHP